jgi:hypothetical protein
MLACLKVGVVEGRPDDDDDDDEDCGNTFSIGAGSRAARCA